MKNNKTKKLWLLISIIFIVIIVLVVLFATGIINLNSKTNDSEVQLRDKNEDNTNNILKDEEVLEIVKEKFLFVEKYFNDSQVYCGENSEIEYEMQKDGMPYYKSGQFKTFDELNTYLSKYMTNEVRNQKFNYNTDYYIEQNGSLYCWMLGAGELEVIEEEKTEYNIKNVSKTQIDVVVKAYYDSPEGEISSDINITLNNDDDNWIISKYEAKYNR